MRNLYDLKNTVYDQSFVRDIFDEAEAEGKVAIYEKVGKVLARPAMPGETIQTVIGGKIETTKTAIEGDMVVLNPGGEQYIIGGDTFSKRYKSTGETTKREGLAWEVYEAFGKIKAFKYHGASIKFKPEWGGSMRLEDGDMLAKALDSNSVDRIEAGVFQLTYKKVDQEKSQALTENGNAIKGSDSTKAASEFTADMRNVLLQVLIGSVVKKTWIEQGVKYRERYFLNLATGLSTEIEQWTDDKWEVIDKGAKVDVKPEKALETVLGVPLNEFTVEGILSALSAYLQTLPKTEKEAFLADFVPHIRAVAKSDKTWDKFLPLISKLDESVLMLECIKADEAIAVFPELAEMSSETPVVAEVKGGVARKSQSAKSKTHKQADWSKSVPGSSQTPLWGQDGELFSQPASLITTDGTPLTSFKKVVVMGKTLNPDQKPVKETEEILDEGFAAVRDKYGESFANLIAKIDPTPQKKYMNWVVANLPKENRDAAKLGADTLDYFSSLLTRYDELSQKGILKGKDIYQLTPKQVEELIAQYRGVKTKTEKSKIAKQGAIEVFNNGELRVLWIRTKAAAIAYGRGTKWCVAAKNHNMFSDYSSLKRDEFVLYVLTKNPEIGKLSIDLNKHPRYDTYYDSIWEKHGVPADGTYYFSVWDEYNVPIIEWGNYYPNENRLEIEANRYKRFIIDGTKNNFAEIFDDILVDKGLLDKNYKPIDKVKYRELIQKENDRAKLAAELLKKSLGAQGFASIISQLEKRTTRKQNENQAVINIAESARIASDEELPEAFLVFPNGEKLETSYHHQLDLEEYAESHPDVPDYGSCIRVRNLGRSWLIEIPKGWVVTRQQFRALKDLAFAENRNVKFCVERNGRMQVFDGVDDFIDNVSRILLGENKDDYTSTEAPHDEDFSAILNETKAQESTEEFRRWFKDSVVRNEDGSPKVVYHMTNVDFTEFRPFSHFGTRQQANAIYDKGAGRILPVYLSIQNPVRMRDLGSWDERELKDKKAEGYDGVVYLNRSEGITPDDLDMAKSKGYKVDADSLRELSDEQFKTAFPKQEDSYIIFNPKQAKSAIGNKGTFSRTRSNITEAVSPAQKTQIDKLLDELLPVLDLPWIPRPKIEVVQRLNEKWLGLCRFVPETQSTSTILLQQFILGDEDSLKRIIAHELCHHAEYMSFFKMGKDQGWDIKKTLGMWKLSHPNYGLSGNHGPGWQVFAKKYNDKYGPDFVTVKSDQAIKTQELETTDITVLIWKEPGPRFYWAWSAKPSPEQRQYIDRVLSGNDAFTEAHNAEVALVTTRDPLLTFTKAKIGKAMVSSKKPEVNAKLKQLWDAAQAKKVYRPTETINEAATSPMDNPNFKAWFGKSKVVDSKGRPLVVYHGTTHEFSSFKITENTDKESYLGAGYYFTSSAEDASENYASLSGPDLAEKIEADTDAITEEFEQDLDDENVNAIMRRLKAAGYFDPASAGLREEIAKHRKEQGKKTVNCPSTEKALKTLLLDLMINPPKAGYSDELMYLAEFVATSKRRGKTSQGHVLPVYLKIENPVILSRRDPKIPKSTNGTWFEIKAHYNKKRKTWEAATGNGVELYDTVISVATDLEIEEEECWDKLYLELADGGRSALDIVEFFSDEVADVLREVGSNVGEFLKVVFQALGFDGVIINAGECFVGMKCTQNAWHYVVWDPTQIKSAVGNKGTFSPKSADIREDKELLDEAIIPPTKNPNFRAWFGKSKVVDSKGRPLVVYHGTTHEFSSFKVTGNANEENYLGTGYYFTSSAEDASENYASLFGPDLITKILRDTDTIEQDFEQDMDNEDIDAIIYSLKDAGYFDSASAELREEIVKRRKEQGKKVVKCPSDEKSLKKLLLKLAKRPESPDYVDILRYLAEFVATSKHRGKTSQGHVLPVYLKIENPVILSRRDPRIPKSTDGTWFEITLPYNEEDDEFEEATGNGVELYNTMMRIAADLGIGGEEFWGELYQKLVDEGMSALDIVEFLNDQSFELFAEAGSNVGQFLKEVFQALGFDGVILNAGVCFSRMKCTQNAWHYIVWNPTQIKSATGNKGTYNPQSNDIKEDKELLDEAATSHVTAPSYSKRVSPASYLRNTWETGVPFKPPVTSYFDRLDKTAQKNLLKWFGHSKVVDKWGRPRVVFHGTLRPFSKFSYTQTSGGSNYFGTGFYFTSSVDDASKNYANISGADLQWKLDHTRQYWISNLSDLLAVSLDKLINTIKKAGYFDLEDTYSEAEIRKVLSSSDEDTPQYSTMLFNIATSLATQTHLGKTYSEGHVLPVYLRIENPVVISPSGGTTFKLQATLNNDGTINKLIGGDVLFYEKLTETVKQWGLQEVPIWSAVNELLVEGVSAYELVDTLDSEKDEFKNIGATSPSVFLAEVFKRTGYDGIILDAETCFGSMPCTENAWHYVVWNANQIKSAIGNKGTFSKRNNDIRENKELTSEVGDTSALNEVVVPDSPEFKKWFGDSKIVNPDGTPRVVYHGTSTPHKFTEFKKGGRGLYTHPGIYFSFDPKLASKFAFMDAFGDVLDEKKHARIYPVYLSVQHPWDYRKREDVDKLSTFLASLPSEPSAPHYSKKKWIQILTAVNNWRTLEWVQQEHHWFEKNGYDGYFALEAIVDGFQKKPRRTIAVLDPKQIKSATGNAGTFASSSNDLRETKTLLIEEAAAPDSPEFKKWFGDSKIVNPDGSPRVVYHGTSASSKFTEFRDGGRSAYAHSGIYFSFNPSLASTFATPTFLPSQDARVYPVYLSVQHPWDYKKQEDVDKLADFFVKHYADIRITFKNGIPNFVWGGNSYGNKKQPAAELRKLWMQVLTAPNNWEWLERANRKHWFEKNGYDGYYTREAAVKGFGEKHSTRAIAVLRPEQIKSVTGNVGSFSSSSRDIRETKTPLIEEAKAPDSPAFKKWFGHSKIVNPDGTPKIMYHGTSKLPIFSRFKKPRSYKHDSPTTSRRIGISVTSSPEFASAFADINDFEWYTNEGNSRQREYAETTMKPRVIPVYVRCEHPWDYENPEDVESLAEEIRRAEGLEPTDKRYLYVVSALRLDGNWVFMERSYVRDWLKAHGYDGYWSLESFQGIKSRALQVFDPCQIKSAIFNKGTYSRTNCNITESKRLMSETKEPPSTGDTSALNEVVVPDSPEFKKWFGDSKIVNPDGTPKIMYHGTSKLPIFRRFKKPQTDGYFALANQRIGISVAPSPELASAFSDITDFEWRINGGTPSQREYANTKMKPRVIPVYVRCEHPWDYTNPEDVEKLAEEIMKVEKLDSADKESLLIALSIEGNWWHIERPYIRDWLESQGYDGYWTLENFQGVTSRTLQVFDPCQIKSAIFNKGTYSRTNCDITENKRLMPETKEPLSTRDTSTRDTSALNEVVVPDSPEFKKWFGDSKIVNPDGTPKVMYHGTSKLPIFSRFKKPRRRKYDLPTTKRRIGISVSESPEFASAFSDMNNFERYINKGSSKRRKYADTKMKPRVIPAYVRCEHPWDYENPKDVESLAEEIMRVEKTKFADKKSLLTTLSTEENWWHIERPYIRDWLKAHGYDGYWSLESFRGATSRTLQVFDPCQIKSAIFNKGTYSRTNCNINESKEYSTAVGSLYIMNDVTGSHHGQMEGTLYALKPEDRYAEDFYRKALGAIDWVIYDDELTISNIVVKPELRRKGIATALLKALLEEFPSVKYRASTRTPDGTAFFETDKVKQLFAEKNISLNEEKE